MHYGCQTAGIPLGDEFSVSGDAQIDRISHNETSTVVGEFHFPQDGESFVRSIPGGAVRRLFP